MCLAPVRVNAVSPGILLTEHVKQNMPGERLEAAVASLPIPRLATPEDAAKACIYLLPNEYITGQSLPLDGARLLL
jgi:NAD(P)-dependent dehydrogenase (short-subunit alcohol dehydrogenase family)